MTQEALPPEEDPITQVQTEIDQQQEVTPAPQPITQDQVQAMLDTQAATYQRQISGLQSGFDRALNGIREQYQDGFSRQDANVQSEIAWSQAISGMDEETQATVRALRQAENQRIQVPTTEPVQPIVQPTAPVGATPEQAQEAVVQSIARGMGIDPSNPGINRAILSDPGLTQEQRMVQFLANLADVKVQLATSQPQVTPQPTTQTVNPPVDRGAGGTAGGLRTKDQLDDALILGPENGGITRDQYIERMNQMGQPVQ